MNSRVLIGIGIVGVAGIGLAVALLLFGPGTPRVEPEVSPAPPESAATPTPRMKERPVNGDDPPAAPIDDGPVEVGLATPTMPSAPPALAGSLTELTADYEEALDVQLDIDPDADGANPDERHRSLRGQILAASAQVEASANAHLAYAEVAPRAEAQQAVDRAAELYDHLSEVITAAPIPQGLPAEEADIQRKVLQRMANAHARKAASLRAQGAPRQDAP